MAMWLNNKRIQGFTLFETVVTLGIAVMLVVLPSLHVGQIQQDVTKKQFVNSFVTEFNYSIRKSLTSGKSISIRKIGQEIIFSCEAEKNSLQIPKNFFVSGLDSRLVINKDRVSSPRTVTFRSGDWNKKIKIQMVWGQIIEN